MQTVEISDNSSLKSTGGLTFQNCTSLKAINIPDGCAELGYRAFYNCGSLETINISEKSNIEIIGVEAFYNCSALKAIYIPCKVYQISNYSFYGCSSLTTVTIPESVNVIGAYAFYETDLQTAYISMAKKWSISDVPAVLWATSGSYYTDYIFNATSNGTSKLSVSYKVADYSSSYYDYFTLTENVIAKMLKGQFVPELNNSSNNFRCHFYKSIWYFSE